MKFTILTFCTILILLGCSRSIPARGAKQFIGKSVTVTGIPSGVLPTGTLIFLTFGFPHPKEDFLVGGINGEVYPAGFTSLQLEKFLNYKVSITGVIYEQQIDGVKYPAISITSLSDIKIEQ